MVKGNSRQVIVVHNPDPKLFEQAIFILKDEAIAQGLTDDLLLKEARRAVHGPRKEDRQYAGAIWAACGAAATGLIWLVTALL